MAHFFIVVVSALVAFSWSPGSAPAQQAEPSAALAGNQMVERGVEAQQNADFALALKLFQQAESSHDLTRRDVLRLLEGKALVHYAIGKTDEFVEDIQQLAALAPKHRFANNAPPEVRQSFEAQAAQQPGPLSIRVQRDVSEDEATLNLIISHNPKIVHDAQLWTRIQDQRWRQDEKSRHIEAKNGTLVEYYALAKGPGDAVLANVASRLKPERFQIGGSAGGQSSVSPWAWAFAGASLVAVGLGIALAVVLNQNNRSSGSTAMLGAPP